MESEAYHKKRTDCNLNSRLQVPEELRYYRNTIG